MEQKLFRLCVVLAAVMFISFIIPFIFLRTYEGGGELLLVNAIVGPIAIMSAFYAGRWILTGRVRAK